MAGASKRSLDRLLARRLGPKIDRAERELIDKLILERFEETWTVAFTDLVGFSRKTRDFGIVHFLAIIYEKGRLLKPVIDDGGGLILKEEADSWLMIFRNPEAALATIIECQRRCQKYNVDRAEEDRVELCVGLGHGPVLKIGDEDIWGREVNYASKLGEDLAKSGEILVTEDFQRAFLAQSTKSQDPLGVTFEEKQSSFGSIDLSYFQTNYSL